MTIPVPLNAGFVNTTLAPKNRISLRRSIENDSAMTQTKGYPLLKKINESTIGNCKMIDCIHIISEENKISKFYFFRTISYLAQTIAKPIPVLPDDASTTVCPGLR